MSNTIGAILLTSGLLLLLFAQITAVGILLYQWGSIGLTLGASAWIAFKSWITLVVIGGISTFAGVVLKD